MSLPRRFLVRQAVRELRALFAKGALFVACLAVGVAAVVGVAGLADAIEAGLRAKARELLAADVAIESRQPIPEPVRRAAEALPGARIADVTEMYSMAALAGPADGDGEVEGDGPARRSQLVEIKAVGEGWPFHGALVLEPPRPLGELLTDDTVLVAPALATRLRLADGDELRLGEATFRVAGRVVTEPDASLGRAALAPRVLLTQGGAARTQLVGKGSRQQRKLLVALPPETDARAAAESLKAASGNSPFVEIESYRDAQPELRRQVERAEQFLGLVALLSLVIGGAGIAQASRAWLRGRVDAIALLRCLGLRPADVLVLFLCLACALGLTGAGLGVVAGLALLRVAPPFLEGLVEGVTVTAWQPVAAAQGLGLGLLTALAFSAPTLLELLRVPALRALRSSAEPPPPRRGARIALVAGLLIAGLAGASIQAGSLQRGAAFVGVLVVTTLALMGAALLAARAMSRLSPSSGRAWLRLATGAASRPGSGMLSASVALGLGTLVVLTVLLVQAGLRQELMARLPVGAPSTFLLDIQPPQWPGIRDLLAREGATDVLSTPMLVARLRSIDGRDVLELAKEGREGRSEWALTREQRLTWWRDLPEDNEIVAGALWSDPARAEVSVEEEFAEDLGLKVGTEIEIDVLGVPMTLVVTSLRKVEWRTFRINFFLVVEPGVLEEAPHSVLAAARLPEGREEAVQDELVALAPNVTAIPIRDALNRFEQVVTRMSSGVRAVGGFSVVAGLAILAGAVAAGASRRGTEIALLKALGMTRREAAGMLVAEHAALGLVSGVIGAAGASALSWIVLVRVMELPFHLRPGLLGLTVLGVTVLAAACGTLVSARALQARPIEALRREE